MNAVRPIKGLWLRVRDDGIVPTFQGLIDGFTPKLWHIYNLANLTAGKNAPCLIESDLSRLSSLRVAHPRLTSEYFRDEARRADRCFFALMGNQLAGIVWILDARHPSRVIALGANDVELAFLYVEHEFRGRGIARALIQEACRVLPRQGVEAIYSIIEEHNLPSQQAFLASGFERVAAMRRPLFVGRRYHAPSAG